MPDLGTSFREGSNIGEHILALLCREASIPRRHIRFAGMDSLEQLAIGFLSGRERCEVGRIRSMKKPVSLSIALRPVTTGAVLDKEDLPTRYIAALSLGLNLSLRHSPDQKTAHEHDR